MRMRKTTKVFFRLKINTSLRFYGKIKSQHQPYIYNDKKVPRLLTPPENHFLLKL